MKRQMQTFIRILLLTAVILFAGCNRDKIEQLELGEVPQVKVSPLPKEELEVTDKNYNPGTKKRWTVKDLYSPDPHEIVTPDDYYGDPLYYVAGVEYESICATTTGIESHSPYIQPELFARFSDVFDNLYSSNGKKLTHVDRNIAASEFLVDHFNFSDLDAAKFFSVWDSAADTTVAINYAQRVTEAEPDNFEAHLVHTELLSKEGSLSDEEREAAYRKLHTWKPNSVRVLSKLAVLVENVDEVIEIYERIAQISPTYQKGLYLKQLGDLYQTKEDYDKALAVYKKKYELLPNSSRPSSENIDAIEKGTPLIKKSDPTRFYRYSSY